MRKKLLEHVERLFDKPPCDVCHEILRQKGKEPKDCAVCLPSLDRENEDAVKVYLLTRNQLIFSGMGDAVDINHLAVHEAMRLYKVKDRKDCFEKVLLVAAHMLDRARDQRDGNEALGAAI